VPPLATLLSVLLLIQTTGCTTWSTVHQPWPTTAALPPNRPVQVTLRDGTIIKGDSAAVLPDALVVHQAGRRDWLALRDVTRVQVRKTSVFATVGQALLAAAITVAVGYWLLTDCESDEADELNQAGWLEEDCG